MRIHPIRTGLVKIRPRQMAARRSGLGAMADILLDDEWSDWLPVYAWAIEHDEGVTPTLLNGQPVPVIMTVAVQFSLQ